MTAEPVSVVMKASRTSGLPSSCLCVRSVDDFDSGVSGDAGKYITFIKRSFFFR